jgi:hypothetical protein
MLYTHPITELRAVKERAEHERVLNGTNLTLAQYCTLLQSACQQYDSAHRATRSRTRRVYLHDIGDQDDTSGYGESTFDIDTPQATNRSGTSFLTLPRLLSCQDSRPLHRDHPLARVPHSVVHLLVLVTTLRDPCPLVLST